MKGHWLGNNCRTDSEHRARQWLVLEWWPWGWRENARILGVGSWAGCEVREGGELVIMPSYFHSGTRLNGDAFVEVRKTGGGRCFEGGSP